MRSTTLLLATLLALALAGPAQAQRKKKNNASTAATTAPDKSIAGKTKGMTKQDGFFPFYWDEKAGKVWLEISRWNEEFLYVNSLPAGVGSNDIGLDRGQLGGERIVKFVKSGPKVLLLQPNYRYRALSDNPNEVKAVEEAFAQSVLWGFTEVAAEGDKVLVDATAFFLRDAHGVARRLKMGRQGAYALDASRSAIYLPNTLNFPLNTEVEARITFKGGPAGNHLRSVVPNGEAFTVRMHHSFVQLPDDAYTPRIWDPRSGYINVSFYDYATPIDQPLQKRYLTRHRLQRNADGSVAEPIVYYLDPGAPEPIRSALLDGARWWADAFEAAGFPGGFKVEVLPEGAHPLDLRYNVIQWVHRSTRGWSYGSSVVDPRTGEIIKGHVSLGSLRVRQDFLIAEGVLAPYEEGKEVPEAMKEMALARLRQLSAHEVGHTIGLVHNYSSSVNNRASVMDYPHPYIQFDSQGKPDLSAAYAVGIGDWDKVAINYGYHQFAEGESEQAGLEGILKAAWGEGLKYISDQDARPQGGAHAEAHLWDNGANAAEELKRVMEVRDKALDRFGENSIPEGRPWATLEETLVPLYLSHRYQTEAAVKVIGGLYYTYSLKGDGQEVVSVVPPEEQYAALEAVLATLDAGALALDTRIVDMIPPRPHYYRLGRELFQRHTGVAFDPLSAAEAAADHTLALLLHPERAARLEQHHARNAQMPGLNTLLIELMDATLLAKHEGGYDGAVQQAINNRTLAHLLGLATNGAATPQVRGIVHYRLVKLKEELETKEKSTRDIGLKAHYGYAAHTISLYLKNPEELKLTPSLKVPDGSPIGSGHACGSMF